ncbi:MAG: hypothetical protein Q7S44_02010 [bacterium]|nr:hypothetical protein [bacterium]
MVNWFQFIRPARKVLGPMVDNKILLKIFIKDFIVKDNTINNPKLFSIEGPTTQAHPNIEKVWAEAETRGVTQLFNLLGQLGKKDKLEIIEMSDGFNHWDTNMIVLGGQAMKSMDFYKVMDNVAYSMDENNIYNNENGEIIPRDSKGEYGYGIILKSKNPQMGNNGIGILLGGYGTLGTKAAIYYLCNNISKLGKEFGNKYFGLIVRAKASAGEQSVKRLKEFDKLF